MRTAEHLVDPADGSIAVDLTDPELYREGFPHALFDALRRHGPVLRHPRVAVPNAPQGAGF